MFSAFIFQRVVSARFATYRAEKSKMNSLSPILNPSFLNPKATTNTNFYEFFHTLCIYR